MKLALTLPWNGSPIEISPGYTPRTEVDPSNSAVTLGSVITPFGEIALYAGAFLMFFWALWGVFDYLRAEGNKEALAKARKKIQWAVAGFVILIMAFFISDAVQGILLQNANLGAITPVKITDPKIP